MRNNCINVVSSENTKNIYYNIIKVQYQMETLKQFQCCTLIYHVSMVPLFKRIHRHINLWEFVQLYKGIIL